MMDTNWVTHENDQSLTIVHDNRWLAIIGIPLALIGLGVGIGPWFIDEARNSEAWPILAVGSLIGFGIIVAGLSLCFNYESIKADRISGFVEKRKGKSPFQRTRKWPLNKLTDVKIVIEQMGSASGHGTSLHHRFRLVGPNTSILVASCLDSEPIQAEAKRWAKHLNLPLNNESKVN